MSGDHGLPGAELVAEAAAVDGEADVAFEEAVWVPTHRLRGKTGPGRVRAGAVRSDETTETLWVQLPPAAVLTGEKCLDLLGWVHYNQGQLLACEESALLSDVSEGREHILEEVLCMQQERCSLEESLCRDRPRLFALGGVEGEEAVVLQTKIVSLQEVRQNLKIWKQSAMSEVSSLINTKSIKVVSAQDVQDLENSGLFGVKAPDGRLKTRAVGCGNALSVDPTQGDEVYSAGVKIGTIRSLLRLWGANGGLEPLQDTLHQTTVLSRGGEWCCAVMDIHTAFLNAEPLVASPDQVIVIRPPKILQDLEVIQPGDQWLVLRAIYGLRSSPRAWALHRDGLCNRLRVVWQEKTYQLKQLNSDEQAWKLVDENGLAAGFAVWYVDGLMMFAAEELIHAFHEEMGKTWTVTDIQLRFCGLQIQLVGEGFGLDSSIRLHSRHFDTP